MLAARPVYAPLLQALKQQLATVSVGSAEDSALGPLISAEAMARIMRLEQRFEDTGATVFKPDLTLPAQGHFVAPAIVEDVPAASPFLQEEIFGPVLPVAAFDTLEAALNIVSHSPLGLAGYAFTTSDSEADRIIRALPVGSMAINKFGVGDLDAPFAGLRNSGIGVEGGRYGIAAFTTPQFISRRVAMP